MLPYMRDASRRSSEWVAVSIRGMWNAPGRLLRGWRLHLLIYLSAFVLLLSKHSKGWAGVVR